MDQYFKRYKPIIKGELIGFHEKSLQFRPPKVDRNERKKMIFFADFHGKNRFRFFGIIWDFAGEEFYFNWLRSSADFDIVLILPVKVSEFSLQAVIGVEE